MFLRGHILPDFSTPISQCSTKSCFDAARRFMLLSWWCPFRAEKEHLPTNQLIKMEWLIPVSVPLLCHYVDSTFNCLVSQAETFPIAVVYREQAHEMYKMGSVVVPKFTRKSLFQLHLVQKVLSHGDSTSCPPGQEWGRTNRRAS
jgi:hypothetical protein